jgi:hypothetical protein
MIMGHLDETSARFFLISVVGDWQSVITQPEEDDPLQLVQNKERFRAEFEKAKSFWLSNLPEVRKAAGMTESAK